MLVLSAINLLDSQLGDCAIPDLHWAWLAFQYLNRETVRMASNTERAVAEWGCEVGTYEKEAEGTGGCEI